MSDFLFSIGADAAAADAAVQEYVKRTRAALESLGKINSISSDGAKRAIANQEQLLRVAQQRLAVEEKIASAQRGNGGGAANSGSGRSGGFADISAVATRNAAAIGKQKDALDFLNRIMGNTVFKFVEYELVMKAFNGAIGEVMNSLNEASNVQMEMVLQRIYNAQINTNTALKDAIIIAKEWGSDITDVQQAIGLWTKQTSQMHDATGKLVDSQTALAAAAKLAADAEKFHRASGIDSLEVYQKSISIWHELGLSLGQIPHLYDQIAFAATKISPVLKAQPGSTSSQEGIKDIFEGMAESGATLRAQGMDDALIIATVAKQIENLGSTGSKVGNQISTMFGSLNQGGKQLKEWVNILGPDAFKDSESFMDAAIAKVDELKQAQADGLLHVKPQTMNTWRTFLETLSQVKELADQIRGHSQGTLDIIAGAQMNTYNGQVERLKASFQELNLALGTQLLPNATRFIGFLSGSALPVLAAHSSLVVGLVKGVITLGAAYGGLLVLGRVAAMFTAAGQAAAMAATEVNVLDEAASEAALSAQAFANSELKTVPAIDEAVAQMKAEQAALQLLQDKIAAVQWQMGGYAAACEQAGVAMADVSRIAETGALNGIAAFTAGLGNMAAAAMRTAGPLLAMYMAMSALQNFDKLARINVAIDAGIHENEHGVKNITDSIGDVLKSPAVVPDDADANALIARIKANGGPAARQLNNAEWTVNNSKSNDDITDAGELIKQLVADEYNKLHGHKDVAGYDKLDQIGKQLQDMMNHAMGGRAAGMTMPGPGVGAKGKTGGQATEQQIAAEQTNKDKADAMAEISKWRDTANAAGSYAKTLMEVGKSQGFTAELVARLNQHLYDQAHAVQAGENAAKNEITTLQKQQQHLKDLLASHGAHLDANGNVHGGDKSHSAAIYAEAKSWRMAQEAIEKAQGAVKGYEAQKAKLAAETASDLGEAKAWAAISASISKQPKTIGAVTSTHKEDFLGYTGIPYAGASAGNPLSSPEAFNSFIKQLDENLSHTTTTAQKFYVALNQENTLRDIGKTIHDLMLTVKDPKELLVLAQALDTVNKAGDKAAKSLAEAQKSTNEFQKNIQDITTKSATSDAEGIGKLLGLSTGDIDAQKTLIDGYGQINDALMKIDQYVQEQAGGYAGLNATQKQMVQNAVQYLNIQQQLVPLLAQQEQIQSSIAYQAMQATLEKAGQEQIDQAINRLMGTQSNSRVREQLYQSAKDGSWMSPQQTLLKDYLTNTVGAWWKQTVQQMTNTMFGDPAAKARQLEEQMLKTNRDGLTTIVQNEKAQIVDRLFQWETLFAKDVAKLTGTTGGSTVTLPGGSSEATGAAAASSFEQYMKLGGVSVPGVSGGQNPGAGAQGTEANPTVVTTVGDGGQGLFSGQTSQGNMAAAVGAGLEQSQTLKNIESNTGSMNDTASNAANAITQQAAGATPSTGGGSSLLSGLLGPLSQIPGLSKYLSGNGSWLNGLAGAVGEGGAFGTMFGGAGSTNTTWGSLGGAIGFGAGMAIGGPVGGQIGGMIGGIFGGLFGHSVNPLDEPDVYDTENYGKFVANINGAPGTFNGVTIGPDPQFDISDGEQSMGTQMYQWALKNPNDSLAKQIIALGPKLDIASEYQGMFTLGSGKTISVTAYEQLGQEWMSKANTPNAPIVSVNAYGGGGAAGAYNTPGMSSSEFLAQEQAWAEGINGQNPNYGSDGPLQGGGSGGGGGAGGAVVGGGAAAGIYVGYGSAPSATPGYGGRSIAYGYGPGVSITSLQLQFTTPVYLDGKVITQVVNAYNAQQRSNNGNFRGIGPGQ